MQVPLPLSPVIPPPSPAPIGFIGHLSLLDLLQRSQTPASYIPQNSMGTYQAFCKVPLGPGETETLPLPAGGGGVPQTPTFLLHMLSTPGLCSACLS